MEKRAPSILGLEYVCPLRPSDSTSTAHPCFLRATGIGSATGNGGGILRMFLEKLGRDRTLGDNTRPCGSAASAHDAYSECGNAREQR